MNAEKMTREEFDEVVHTLVTSGDGGTFRKRSDDFWRRIDAIQNRPFQPDWSLMPKGKVAFAGSWWIGGHTWTPGPGEFYIPAPNKPTDAELSAMFDAFDLETKKRAIEAVKEMTK